MRISVIDTTLNTFKGARGLIAVTSIRGSRCSRSIERPTRKYVGHWLEEGHTSWNHILLQEVL